MKNPELTVVVPTRNEADNVPVLMHELRESLSGIDYRVVFVDDWTDETPEVIRGFCASHFEHTWTSTRPSPSSGKRYRASTCASPATTVRSEERRVGKEC